MTSDANTPPRDFAGPEHGDARRPIDAGAPNAVAAQVDERTARRALHRLFLTLYLRGHSARGLNKKWVPKSIGSKLTLSLFFYFALGLLAIGLQRSSIFSLSVYLQSMTILFLGMFVASSAGEVLFNKEEADILMHRPIEPRALLWAKISVLIQVSLWVAGALNLVGLFVGTLGPNGHWQFAVVHACSTALEAMFCISGVVMVYQLCLRWFGRERLDGLMTTAQVVVSVGAVLSGQLLPQIMSRSGGLASFSSESWWIGILPPAWFAGFDDALAGSGTATAWALASAGLLATAVVSIVAFGKLAGNYQAGLQMMNESVSPPARRRIKRRWISALLDRAPLRWWLRNPIERAAFLLTAAYIARDRDVKLRVFPQLAPMLVLPVVMLVGQPKNVGFDASPFMVAFVGSYLGLVPLFAMHALQYSQGWRAADIFRAAPVPGPAHFSQGARRAVLLVLTLPAWIIFLLIVWFMLRRIEPMFLLLPGTIALPVFSMVPTIGGGGVPLSLPVEDAKSIGRGLMILPVMMVSFVISGVAAWAWSSGWYCWFLIGETLVAVGAYVAMHRGLAAARWPAIE